MENKRLPEGKVPWEVVAKSVRGKLPSSVLLGPAQGEDAALVRMGDEVWAVASDPVTFTAGNAGKLSVIINANDVAVRGAEPRFFTAVVLVAPGASGEGEVRALLSQIRRACEAMGIALVGGHTEVTPGLKHTLIAGTMLGRVIREPIRTGGLRPGDWIGMTKWAGLEGTSILLKDREEDCRRILGDEVFSRAEHYFAQDFISVVPEALAAAAQKAVSALHDVTEGGVGEALHEMAAASGLSLKVTKEAIPIRPETALICKAHGIDPLGLIGSGALLVGCSEEGKASLEAALHELEIPFVWIGRTEESEGAPLTGLPRFERDEILKAFE
jgi:hydrogenase maturation factor